MNAVVIDTETTGTDQNKCKLLSTCYYNGSLSYEKDVPKFKDHTPLIGHNIKYDLVVLRRHGFNQTCPAVFDTMIAQYLLDISQPRKLEKLVEKYFGEKKDDLLAVYNLWTSFRKEGEGKKFTPRKTLPEDFYEAIPPHAWEEYAKADVVSTKKLYEVLIKKLSENPDLENWFYTVEMPLVNILAESELKGCRVDTNALKKLQTELSRRKDSLERDLLIMADNDRLNLNSSKQLQDVLFNKFRLRKVKKTKKGALSTDNAVLTLLAKSHAFPKYLLAFRECEKVLNTFVTPLLENLDSHGRIHTTFNQALTKTMRFSSENPNLQNIPAKGIGQRVRDCFIPSKQHKFLILDYSQIELRLLADASSDPLLIDAYKTGKDVHQITADSLGISRRDAKTINFSVVYGTQERGLSENLGCSVEDAKTHIQNFLNTYKGLKEYFRTQEELAVKSKGWVLSYPANECRMRLYVGDTTTDSKGEYNSCIRRAINAPIQCGSQVLMKKAIVQIYNELGLVPVLMVHDELVYEITPTTPPEKVVSIMESVANLQVPLEVSYKVSDKWEK